MIGDLHIPNLRSLRSGSNASLGAMLVSLIAAALQFRCHPVFVGMDSRDKAFGTAELPADYFLTTTTTYGWEPPAILPPWWIGPCVVDDPSDALLFSIFELVWPELSLRGEEDMSHQAMLAGVPNVFSQLALISMHLIKVYPLIVDLRLALPNVEPDWPLLLEPIAYSSSRRRTLSQNFARSILIESRLNALYALDSKLVDANSPSFVRDESWVSFLYLFGFVV
ncbi:hypothetical protein EDD85DRAFT_789877 [Armillaria nabsnona]|nr:hypothetical protein EDD85DRAFT_789877 [Armillaria nabsnona]